MQSVSKSSTPFLPAAPIRNLLFAALLAAGGAAPALAQAPETYELKLPDGGTYIGTLSNGKPDGKGYFRDPDGMQYEGDVRMGQRSGFAQGVFPKGDRYEGEWKDGKPDGIGTMRYMLGGAYQGEWRNGQRHGKGTMTFAGSGRRAEVRFDHGTRVDVEVPQPSEATCQARYPLTMEARVGSLLPEKVGYTSLPIGKNWEELTPDQQRLRRSQYLALDPADDPPYPVKGGRELYLALATLSGQLSLRDTLVMYVSVDANGKASGVSTFGKLEPEIKRAIGAAAAQLTYRPAYCGGKPCAGVVPFDMGLDHHL